PRVAGFPDRSPARTRAHFPRFPRPTQHTPRKCTARFPQGAACAKRSPLAPLAQLDRASASGAEGRRFESCEARRLRGERLAAWRQLERTSARPLWATVPGTEHGSCRCGGRRMLGRMAVQHHAFTVSSTREHEVIDVTDEVTRFVR